MRRFMKHMPSDILEKFQSWPAPVAARAFDIRNQLLAGAAETGAEDIKESLKWGEPALRPVKGGTTLRLNWSVKAPGEIGLFVDCKTDLCARMQADFPEAFRYAPPRALWHDVSGFLPKTALAHLARIAFRYKRVIPAG